MTEETKLYIYGTNEPYAVLGNDEHDEVTNPSHYQGSQGLEVIEANKNIIAQMNHLESIEYLCKQYINEASVECVNKAKIKRLGIELRQATLEFERKNLI